MNWNRSKGKSCCILASEKQNQPCPGGLKKAKRLGSRPCVRNKPRTRACRELPGALLPASSGSGSSLLTTTLISLDLIPFYFLFEFTPLGWWLFAQPTMKVLFFICLLRSWSWNKCERMAFEPRPPSLGIGSSRSPRCVLPPGSPGMVMLRGTGMLGRL